ncbi:MAG: hypothetical protein R2873_24865 [Caldilineaceae bacterium]
MTDKGTYRLPVWAHRLRKSQIERLYQSCSQGFVDEELIDEVGFALYSRCLSMLEVREAMFGRLPCPGCDAAAQIDDGPDPLHDAPTAGGAVLGICTKRPINAKDFFSGGLTPLSRSL